MSWKAIVAAAAGIGVASLGAFEMAGPGLGTVLAAPAAAAAAPAAAPAVGQGTNIDELVVGLTVVKSLPKVPGYERDCTKGKACVYGPAWTDDYTGPSSHDGCDTRNNVLGTQLVNVRFKPGTRDCKVIGGTLHDPYTGKTIEFDPKKSSAIQIDHVFPLSRSWSAGASKWTLAQRTSFANDTALNLLASDGPANQAKSDKGLDKWMPANAGYRCEYAIKYLTVAKTYQLAVTTSEVDVARTACSNR
ncbi:hypothetical protein ABIC28_005144 [Rhodococcus sp. PvR044]